jgi:ribosomal protein L11 methyltransferase
MTIPHNPTCQWLKVSIKADQALTESIEDFLMGIVGAGVEISVDQPDSNTLINVWFDKKLEDQLDIDLVQTQISNHLLELADIFKVAAPSIETTFIDDEDWSATWKEHFKPFAIIPGLVIAPTWEPYQPQKDERVIVMDPGMAFGTGHHATTSLSLQLLQTALTGQSLATVLDVGTGTGILGMAAALFGATQVMAIDNDPLAVNAARENIVHNHLQKVMAVENTPLAALTIQHTLVIANIVHDILLELATDLARLTMDGGWLILSGILRGQQVETIISCFTNLGFFLKQQEEKKEWAALLFSKELP